jgi:hypothetical protein
MKKKREGANEAAVQAFVATDRFKLGAQRVKNSERLIQINELWHRNDYVGLFHK